MSIFSHGRQTYRGTAAERAGTTPDAEAVAVRWFETDTGNEFIWDGSAWVTGGWKLGETIVVSDSGNGDYTTIAGAISAASSGDTIVVDAGSYTCDAQTLPTGVDLWGLGVITTTLSTTTSATTLTLNGTNYVHNLMIQNFYSSGSITQAVQVSGSNVRCYNVRAVGFNAGGGGTYAWLVDSGTQPILLWCEGSGLVSGGGSGYGMYVDGGDAKIYFGGYSGATYGVYLNAPSAAIEFFWPYCEGGTADVDRAGGTAPEGWFLNDTGVLRGLTDSVITMEELAATPANPPAGSWSMYFLSDGLYYLEDDGTEVGPLS